MRQTGAMVLLVTGGRKYADWVKVQRTLDPYKIYKPSLIVIEGGAEGADRMAEQWCIKNGVQYARVPAMWEYYRTLGTPNIAGPMRNNVMLLLRPDKVVAFPGGKGTAHMVSIAKQAGIEVEVID